MSKKETVLKIPGANLRVFREIFGSYINTHSELSEGIISDFNGTVDTEGNFYITKKGKDSEKRLNYEAKLTGKIKASDDGKETELRYSLYPSGALIVCLIVLGILCAGLLAYALTTHFTVGNDAALLPASFFAAAYVILLVVSVFRPECRSLEKVLDKIVGEYAARLDTEEKKDDKI